MADNEEIEIRNEEMKDGECEHHIFRGGKKNDLNKKNEVIPTSDYNTPTYITSVFTIFMIVWTFVITYNKFFLLSLWPILLIPYGLFGLGIINAGDIADDEIEENVFSTTFVTMGLVISLPLLTMINKDKQNKELTHIIFLGMIFTLFSYFHLWVDKPQRHVCKIIRSCLETIAVDLYILALTIFFILT